MNKYVAVIAVSLVAMGCPDPEPTEDAGFDAGWYIPPVSNTDGGGKTDGGGTGGDGGVGVVTGTLVDTMHTSTGTWSQPQDLSSETVAAYVYNPQTSGWTTYPGVGTVNGTFAIPDVPQGEYYLKVGMLHVVTSARSVKLGGNDLSRQDVVDTDGGTTVTFNLTGMTPWKEGDDLMMVAPNAGLQYFSLRFMGRVLAGQPTAGATATSGLQVDWYRSLYSQAALLQGSKGDELSILHLTTQVQDGGLTIEGATESLSTTAISMQDKQDNVVSGAFQPLTPQSATLDFRGAAFGQVDAQLIPAAEVWNASAFVDVMPYGAFPGSGGPDLARVTIEGQARDVAAQLSFGNPYPSSWLPRVGAEISFDLHQTLSFEDGGTSERWSSLTTSVRNTLAAATSGPVQPLVGPVVNPQINGQSAFLELSGVGTSPTLSWSPPTLGTPRNYYVFVYRLYPSATNPTALLRQTKGVVHTKGTSVRIPPALMTPGEVYYLVIVSEANATSASFESEPFAETMPVGHSQSATALIRP